MDRQSAREFVRAVLAFQPEIRVDDANADEVMTAAVDYDSRILFYIASISQRRGPSGIRMLLAYRNREVPLSRVFRVWNSAQAQQVLCREIGGWSECFGIVMHQALDPKTEVRLFLRRNSLSRLHQLGWSRGECRWGWTMVSIRPVYLGDRNLVMEQGRRAEEEAARISRRLFLPGMPPEVKCLAAHNYLAATVRYKLPGEDPLEQYRRCSAYGPLVEKIGVCQGYAEAFQMLMKLAGIDCMTVSGSTKRRGDENHSWNLVHLPSEGWFHVDVTWDSREGSTAMTYYLRSDGFLQDRGWDREHTPAAPRDSAGIDRAARWLRQNREALLHRGFPREALPGEI